VAEFSATEKFVHTKMPWQLSLCPRLHLESLITTLLRHLNILGKRRKREEKKEKKEKKRMKIVK